MKIVTNGELIGLGWQTVGINPGHNGQDYEGRPQECRVYAAHRKDVGNGLDHNQFCVVEYKGGGFSTQPVDRKVALLLESAVQHEQRGARLNAMACARQARSLATSASSLALQAHIALAKIDPTAAAQAQAAEALLDAARKILFDLQD